MRSVASLFDINKGHQLALNRVVRADSDPNAVAFVTRSHRNSGIAAWVKRIGGLEPAAAGSISVVLRSRNHTLTAFVQPRQFYTTYHVAILTPKRDMTLREKLWWCLCIRANQFRFHFGRQANRTIGSLLLPDAMPSWVADTAIPGHTRESGSSPTGVMDISAWEAFSIPQMFALRTGVHVVRRALGNGTTPLVTASAWNNGITAMVAAPPDWPGGQITVANNGSVGAAFYQPRPFTATRDVTVLEPTMSPLSAAAALFICTVLRRESRRFNYARKWTVGRMRESSVRLPATGGRPDLGAMAAFMARLPLGWSLR